MNTLSGTISNIKSTDHLSYVTIDLGKDVSISTIILETPGTLSYLSLKKNVRVLFKETEVILSRAKFDSTSLENSFNGVIKKIDCGDVLTRIECETEFGNVCSIITAAVFDKLKMAVGYPIVVSINSSEIMLSE